MIEHQKSRAGRLLLNSYFLEDFRVKLRSYSKKALAAAAALSIVLVGCAPTQAETTNSQSEELTLVSSITGSSFLAVTAGVERGIFEKHGLRVKVVSVKSSAEAAAAVASGKADIAAMLPEGVLAVHAAGGDMKMIGNLLNQVQYRIEASPEVQSAQDFVGQKIGIVGPGSGEEILARAFLAQNGVNPSDVQFIATGPQASKFAALTSGQIQGALLVPPFDIMAETKGMNPVGILRDAFTDIPAQVYAGTSESLESNEDSVRKFLSAVAESSQWIVDNDEAATDILAEDTSIGIGEAEKSYLRAQDAYSLEGRIDPAGLEKWLEISAAHGSLRELPSVPEIYDDQYLPGK